MRSGVTRAVLRGEVQIEAGLSTAAGHAVQTEARINHLLNRMERQLATRHTWPTLTFEISMNVVAETQFATLPVSVDFTKVNEVWVYYGEQWSDVSYGIGAAERNIYNSTQRATPIRRWEIKETDNTQFEVWPIGAVDQTLRFTAERMVGVMNNDSATCRLDGDALVLMVAGELLAKGDPEQAKLKLAAADSIVRNTLNRQTSRKQENVNLAAKPRRGLREGIDFIAPGRSG